MAQRMESVAPPGGVMLSASTARLVEGAASLGELELVRIKGAGAPVPARRLLGLGDGHRAARRAESNLVGRRWEMAAAEGLLDRATDGHGAVVGVVGSPGIGKSRLAREVTAMAAARGVEVFTAFCESARQRSSSASWRGCCVPPPACAASTMRPLVRRCGLNSLDADPGGRAAKLEDLLGIADPGGGAGQGRSGCAPAAVDRAGEFVQLRWPAKPRRSTSLLQDAHWIDEVSESMIAGFVTVVLQTHSLVLITYRPEYRGALSRVPGAQSIALAPLSDSEIAALAAGLLGPESSVGGLAATIVERAAGNPFFVEEMVARSGRARCAFRSPW